MTPVNDPEPTVRQREIVDLVMELVRENGLAGLTTRRIAAQVGFSEAALYRHFHSKEALMIGLMDRLEQLLVVPVQDIAASTGLAAKQRLQKILHHHIKLIRQQNSLPILLLAEAAISEKPALVDRMRSILDAYLKILKSVIREDIQQMDRADKPRFDCLALLLLGAPAALAIHHRFLPDGDLENRFDQILIPFLISSLTQKKR